MSDEFLNENLENNFKEDNQKYNNNNNNNNNGDNYDYYDDDLFIYDDPLADISEDFHSVEHPAVEDIKNNYETPLNVYYIKRYDDQSQLIGYQRVNKEFNLLFDFFLFYETTTLSYLPKRRRDYILPELLKFLKAENKIIYDLFKEYFTISNEEMEIKDEEISEDFLWFIDFKFNSSKKIENVENKSAIEAEYSYYRINYNEDEAGKITDEKKGFTNEGFKINYVVVKYHFSIYVSSKNKILSLNEMGRYIHFDKILDLFNTLVDKKKKTPFEYHLVNVIHKWKLSFMEKY